MPDVRALANGGGLRAPSPVTFRQYARSWIEQLWESGSKSAGTHESRLETHLIPAFGDRPLEDLDPFDIREFVKELRGKRAYYTANNIYSTLQGLYSRAVADELVLRSPCVLISSDRPPKKHKRADFQALELFEAWEVRKIIEAATIPKRWRVIYATSFLTGVRPGELFALPWEHVELSRKPLGRILVVGSYDRKRDDVGTTKTEVVREVPILPQLGQLLRWWRKTGYRELTGCVPWPRALVFPRVVDGLVCSLTDDAVRQRFYRDLDRLGLRRRRFYSTRRTFVTLVCAAEGVSKDVVRRTTHARESDVHELYNEVPWAVKCRESNKLKV